METHSLISIFVILMYVVAIPLVLYFIQWFDNKAMEKRLTLELPFLSRLPMLEAQEGSTHLYTVKPIIETLEREEKSLAPYIKNAEDKQACLDDLEKIIRCAEIEISYSQHKRKNDLERFVPLAESQKGRVKAWRGHIHYTEQITFETIEGSAEVTRNGDDKAVAVAVTLAPSNWYTLIIESDGQEPVTKPISPEGTDSFDFEKMGIGAIRNGRITIEDEKSGQRERVPLW